MKKLLKRRKGLKNFVKLNQIKQNYVNKSDKEEKFHKIIIILKERFIILAECPQIIGNFSQSTNF